MSLMRVTLFVASFLMVHSSHAQYAWFMDINGANFVGVDCLSLYPDDNVMAVGNFDNGVTLAGSSYSGAGSFLLKISKNGQPLWHKIIRYGSVNFSHVSKVDIDGNGNTYIAGTFPNTVTGEGFSLSSNSPYNGFVIKLNKQGELQWTKVIPDIQEFLDMKVNDVGNVLLYTSYTYPTVTIDGTILDVGANSLGIMLNSSGTLLWAKAIGNPQHYTTWSRSCAIDDDGNAYLHGLFSGTLSMDGHQVISAGGNYDFFVTKINAQGVCQWITPLERKLPIEYETSAPPSGLIIERGATVVDEEQNLYLGGQYWNGIKAGSLSLSGGGSCLLKLNAAGEPVWLQSHPNSSIFASIDNLIIHNNLLYFSGTLPGQFYFSIYTKEGIGQSNVLLPLFGDISSGLGIDSENQLYMSGRQIDIFNLQGFVFKYGVSSPSPASAGNINGPLTHCNSEHTIEFSTPVIAYSDSYEWEIQYEGHLYSVETTTNELILSLSQYGIEKSFSIRVRGKNSSGAGIYSTETRIVVDQPLEAPTLVSTCTQISIDELASLGTISWYYNNAVAEQFGTLPIVTPQKEGDYFVTVRNTCGSVTSNEITFVPVVIDDLMIPNIITPNGDSFNQKFIIDTRLEVCDLIIYNRWGQIVYMAKEYSNLWDGENLSSGVYYYQISSGCASGLLRGSITIAR